MNIIKGVFVSFVIFLLSACGNVEKVEHIEDFYDTTGKYIKNEIKHYTFKKSHITLVEDEKTRNEELHEPSTILLPKDMLKTYQLDNLTKVEEEKVKEHVQSFMDRL